MSSSPFLQLSYTRHLSRFHSLPASFCLLLQLSDCLGPGVVFAEGSTSEGDTLPCQLQPEDCRVLVDLGWVHSAQLTVENWEQVDRCLEHVLEVKQANVAKNHKVARPLDCAEQGLLHQLEIAAGQSINKVVQLAVL